MIVEWAVGNSMFVSVNGVKVVGAKIGFILLSLLLVWCDDKIMMSVISPQYFVLRHLPSLLSETYRSLMSSFWTSGPLVKHAANAGRAASLPSLTLRLAPESAC